jgi:lipase
MWSVRCNNHVVQQPTPFVFVHGLIGSFAEETVFDELEPALCSAPDLDGYGRSADLPVSFAGQVEALRRHIVDVHGGRPVHLIGHSVGAVYAFALADERPELIASLTTVEGNFTLADAFWSRSIAALDEAEAHSVVQARLDDPISLLSGDGVEPTPVLLARAVDALRYQSWSTVWASAKGIVETTARPEYDEMLRRVFAHHPVHLIAGERSVGGWDVPVWARGAAVSSITLPGVGHMMMLEKPREFGRSIAHLLVPGAD